ncbi:hypothetical protein GCM10023321_67350 [Pseudonocardia eucalypti]|uniref:SGNH hydrolase-type esterase domain-containing protein n=2 Tax=Pseudonocardia eucalypti TaxID=648755 RepID=A0ABP9R0T6_9PSEU
MAGAAGYARRRTALAGITEDYAAYWRRRARRPGELVLVALGDSLAQGLTARRPERGFVGLLADELAAREGRTVGVRNLSVTGATVADVLAGQLPLTTDSTDLGQETLVAVCVGTNDVVHTPLRAFRERFAELCAGLPAGALVADVPNFPRGPHRIAARRYSSSCREVLAGFPRLIPVPLERATRAMRFWEVGADLVHPGDPGHRRYAAAYLEARHTAAG